MATSLSNLQKQTRSKREIWRYRMTCMLITYFNWVAAMLAYALIERKRRSATGWRLLGGAAVMQLSAFFLHWYSWKQVQGQPDALYAWIVPFGIALLSGVAIVAALGPPICGLFTRSDG